jgi:hypothetical protein
MSPRGGKIDILNVINFIFCPQHTFKFFSQIKVNSISYCGTLLGTTIILTRARHQKDPAMPLIARVRTWSSIAALSRTSQVDLAKIKLSPLWKSKGLQLWQFYARERYIFVMLITLRRQCFFFLLPLTSCSNWFYLLRSYVNETLWFSHQFQLLLIALNYTLRS